MTTREKLMQAVLDLPEGELDGTLEYVASRREPEPDVVGLPEGWGETLTGEPMPNVVAALRRSRAEH